MSEKISYLDPDGNVIYGNVVDAGSKLASLQSRINRIDNKIIDIESQVNVLNDTHIKIFEANDVYEVNKRIERLDQRLALLESNQRKRQFDSLVLFFMSVNLLLSWILLWLN